jgi:hypothetical protein
MLKESKNENSEMLPLRAGTIAKLPWVKDEHEQLLGLSGPQEARFQALKCNCEGQEQKP